MKLRNCIVTEDKIDELFDKCKEILGDWRMSLDFTLHYEMDGNKIYVYDGNITHNLGEIAGKVGIYKCLWHPEGEFKLAKDIITKLRKGLKLLKKNKIKYVKFEPKNGWGTCEYLILFVEDVLNACEKYPNSRIESNGWSEKRWLDQNQKLGKN